MRKENIMNHRIDFERNILSNYRGSILLNIIVMIVIFSSIISAVVYMSSSSMRQAVSSNQSTNAWNMAEACYRLLSVNYMNTTDANNTQNADDDKAIYLRNVNNRTYVIPNNGSCTLTIRPYWFYNAAATSTGTNISVQLPGTAPTNFIMPGSGQVKLGDAPGIGVKSYTNGVFNNSTGVFTCSFSTNTTLNRGDSVYLVLNPNANQTLVPGSNLTLNLGNFAASAFPAKDGLIEIGTQTRLYRYGTAAQTSGGTTMTLTNLQYAVQRSVASENTFSTPVASATIVTFKKYIAVQSRGQVGAEERLMRFNQPITDSLAPLDPVIAKLDTISQLNANFSRDSSISSYTVASLGTSGGGSAAFSIINSLSTTGSGANAYKCGAFWYSNTSLMNTQWTSASNLLSYDVQLKTATGKFLLHGTLGLALRAKKVSSSSQPDNYFGLTFMKYSLPNLFFTTGSRKINPGDSIVGVSSGATGIVQGDPEITSGSWDTGNARGKIRFTSVTGSFSNSEWLRVGGVNLARMDGTNYFPAATDFIPNEIKPKPSDFSPARYNIGSLLLVLWERKSDGTFRWLAYKDITNDDYAKGLQDWNAPDGSCTANCVESDGQIINDNASIYVRIQERKVDLGSGTPVKVNDINLFYGDASSRYTTPARPGNVNAYDIKELRRRYAVANPFVPVWAPSFLTQWEQNVDFFSHIESGTPIGSQPQFQWDAVNPNISSSAISVLRICDDSTTYCASAANGTLRTSHLVTPDSGTYAQPEIGMLACGNLRESPDYATAGFAEFAFKMSSAGGSLTGGFINTSLSW
jgi:hypothetical protein